MVPIFCDCRRVSGSEISIGSLVRSFLIMTQFLGFSGLKFQDEDIVIEKLGAWFNIERLRHIF